jgi:hypothetical protein
MGNYSKKIQNHVDTIMHEYEEGKLKAAKEGVVRKVKKYKQIVVIGLSEARIKGVKIPSNPINSL